MLIKQADDQSKRLALLESLQNVSTLDRRQRDWLSDQLWALRIGMNGERMPCFTSTLENEMREAELTPVFRIGIAKFIYKLNQ